MKSINSVFIDAAATKMPQGDVVTDYFKNTFDQLD